MVLRKLEDIIRRYKRALDKLRSESQMCPRRAESPLGNRINPGPDYWERMPNGDLTCSYCGSLHPKMFLEFCKDVAKDDSKIEFDQSDKSYKIYIRRPGVKNAMEGAIKYYRQHDSQIPDAEWDKDVVFAAFVAAEARFRKRWNT